MPTLTDRQIRSTGRAILLYQPLPAMRAFHASPEKNRWLCGGNRSGKSEGNIGYDLCSFALGVHPYRRTPKNATIWAAANTWPLVGKLLWSEKIKTYLPLSQIQPPIIWHNRQEEIPAELRLVNGNTIEFKAYEQGRKAFEGRAIDAFYGDEQCKSDSEAIWTEIQARLMDRNGFSAQSMTPIIPQVWLEERIEALPETDEVFYADLEDNRKSRGGHIDDAEIDALIAQWPAEIQETRIKGRFAAFAGAVYKTFNRAVHVVEPFGIPADWPRYRAIDWGFNNPFACLWLARDHDRRWYVYAEHYQARETLAYHAERIKQISGREKYRVTWADHDAQERHEFKTLGLPTMPAKKDVHLGIEAVQASLKVQGDGKPRLFIFKTCRNTVKEMTGYKWSEGVEGREARDEPLPVNDHTCLTGDALVLMADGSEKPISEIEAGDRVRTTNGAQIVEASAFVGHKVVYQISLSNGGELKATADHQIYTPSGKVAVRDLRPNMEVITWNQSFSTDRNTIGTGIITHLLADVSAVVKGFTWQFGNIIMGRFLPVAISTTSTGTVPTIRLRIFNACRVVCTAHNMDLLLSRNTELRRISEKAALGLRSGTSPRRADGGIVGTQNRRGTTDNQVRVSASIVGAVIPRKTENENSALTGAKRRPAEKRARTLCRKLVAFVGRLFGSISIRKPKRVHILAVQQCDGSSAVYDITVAKDHQFYANGVLAANCDCLRYAIYGVEGKFYFSESDLS